MNRWLVDVETVLTANLPRPQYVRFDRKALLATDISRAALSKARRATYGEWSLRGESAAAARQAWWCAR